MKKILILCFVISPAGLLAQKGMVNLWAEYGRPVGEFRHNTNAFGLGLGMGAYFSFDKENIFYLGGDFSYDIYGKSFDTDGVYEVVTNNNMLQLHGVLRIQPPADQVVPFVEGLYGFKYLYTNSKLKEDLLSNADAIHTEFGDFAWSYGGSLGLSVPVGQGQSALDIRIQYLKGSKAEYIDGKMIREEGIDAAIAHPKSSTTDMILLKFGATFGW